MPIAYSKPGLKIKILTGVYFDFNMPNTVLSYKTWKRTWSEIIPKINSRYQDSIWYSTNYNLKVIFNIWIFSWRWMICHPPKTCYIPFHLNNIWIYMKFQFISQSVDRKYSSFLVIIWYRVYMKHVLTIMYMKSKMKISLPQIKHHLIISIRIR